jgi:TATA-binding protein-associated factor Taf7
MGVLGNKIVLNDEIEDFIRCIKNTKWFVNCNKTYDKKLHYKFILEENMKIASKHLTQESHGNFKNLESLFSQADGRLSWFLNRNCDEKQAVRNKLIDIINKRFLKKNAEIDFNNIEREYCELFLINMNTSSWI